MPHDPRHTVARHAHDPEDAQVRVAERHVYGESHAQRVYRASRAYQQRAVDAVPPEQAPPPFLARLGELEAGQDFAISKQPCHAIIMPLSGLNALPLSTPRSRQVTQAGVH
jgi:hypothetical protein